MLCSLDGGSDGNGKDNGNCDGDGNGGGDGDSDGESDDNGDGNFQVHHAIHVIVGGVLGVFVVLIVGVMSTLHCYRNNLCKRSKEEQSNVMPDLTSMQMATSQKNPVFG